MKNHKRTDAITNVSNIHNAHETKSNNMLYFINNLTNSIVAKYLL